MKTILITGSSGFIGNYLAEKFREDYIIIGIDKESIERKFNGFFYKIDIKNYKEIEKVFDLHSIDYVIHAAAEKSLSKCENNFEAAYHTNFTATIEIYNLAKRKNAKFIFISSDQVFDGKHGNYLEESNTKAINQYGELKVLAENILKKDINVAICRTAMVFGEIPTHQLTYFDNIKNHSTLVVQGFIVQHVLHKLTNKEPIILPEDEFITPTSIELLFCQLKIILEENITGIIHCCGSEKVSRYEFGKMIAKRFDLDDRYVIAGVSNDLIRPKDVSLDTTQSSRILNMRFWDAKIMLVRLSDNLIKGE
ncbi:MAG: sugar nucleotide-binding protein [Paludibacter sp.]|nr:sugar nucleotide-binding protein [Paludibacter sp.]